jgi:hypothetical protein
VRARARLGERGAVAAFVVFCLVALVAFVALALNLGHLMAVRGELQNAADMAALSGAGVLDGTAANVANAPTTARTFGNDNRTDSHVAMGVANGDITVGTWSMTARTFTPATATTAPTDVVAVRVRTYRDATHSGPVDVLFGSFLGRSQSNVAASAIAVAGGPSQVPCAQMPIAISACYVDPDANVCGQTFRIYFANNIINNGAWTTFDLGANAADIVALLNGAVSNPPVCTPLLTGKSVNLINGQVNVGCQDLANNVWQQAGGTSKQWVVPVIDLGTPCPPPGTPQSYNKTATVKTFIYISITAVSCGGGAGQGGKYIEAVVGCDQVAPGGSIAGGPFNQSINPMPPVLVQ